MSAEDGSADDAAALAAIERRWTGGGAALALAPDGWRAALGRDGGADAELRLLVLAAGALRMGFAPAADAVPTPRPLLPRLALPTPRPLLPRLALPTMDEGARAQFRVALAQWTKLGHAGLLLELAAARGVAAHPFDWMPEGEREDVPDLYLPWLEWTAGRVGTGDKADRLPTADDLATLPPAARRAVVAGLRRRDPAAARVLVEAVLPGLAAEARTALIAALATGLSPDDAPFLEGLAGDRSSKVRETAALLLARLGIAATAEGDVAERVAGIREAIDVRTAGWLFRRRRVFAAHAWKTNAQLHARLEALERTTLAEAAAALDATPDALVSDWVWGEAAPFDTAMAGLLARSGDDSLLAHLLPPLLKDASLHVVRQLLPRLDPAGWDVVAERLAVGLVATGQPPTHDFAALIALAPAGARRLGTARVPPPSLDALPERVPAAGASRPVALATLGLLLAHDAACRTLAVFARAGHAMADPDLATLRLNAALVPPAA